MGHHQRPVRQELLLVERRPLEDLPEYPRGQGTGQQRERINADGRRLPAVSRVEMRERVVVVVHRDHDSEEGTNSWHVSP